MTGHRAVGMVSALIVALLTESCTAIHTVPIQRAGAFVGIAAGERRSGYVIMLFVGLFAAGMPVIHMRGAHYGEIARSAGGFFFVWTLWALGGLGGFTFVLSARGLWNLRRGQPRS
jgi:biotin transporter BioY